MRQSRSLVTAVTTASYFALASAGCSTSQSYRVARKDYEEALARQKADPTYPVLAVRNGSVIRIQAADVERGRVTSLESGDPIELTYIDSRTGYQAVGYTVFALSLVAMPFVLVGGAVSDNLDDTGGTAFVTGATVTSVLAAAGLAFGLYGSVAQPPYPRAARNRPAVVPVPQGSEVRQGHRTVAPWPEPPPNPVLEPSPVGP